VQIQAFKRIFRGLPVPLKHQAAMNGPRALAELHSQLHDVHNKIGGGDMTMAIVRSGIYP
jgi:hypothetical protein